MSGTEAKYEKHYDGLADDQETVDEYQHLIRPRVGVIANLRKFTPGTEGKT